MTPGIYAIIPRNFARQRRTAPTPFEGPPFRVLIFAPECFIPHIEHSGCCKLVRYMSQTSVLFWHYVASATKTPRVAALD